MGSELFIRRAKVPHCLFDALEGLRNRSAAGVLFPAGMTYDMKTGNGTTTTCLFFSLLREDSEGKSGLAALTDVRWNLLVPWLREMDDRRRSNFLFAVPSSESATACPFSTRLN
jgi:hypothetical protein